MQLNMLSATDSFGFSKLKIPIILQECGAMRKLMAQGTGGGNQGFLILDKQQKSNPAWSRLKVTVILRFTCILVWFGCSLTRWIYDPVYQIKMWLTLI